MIIIPIILAYGLFVAGVTKGLLHLFPRWRAWQVVTAAVIFCDLVLMAVGVVHVLLAVAEANVPDPVYNAWFAVGVTYYAYLVGAVVAIPIGLLACWAVMAGRERSEPETIEPVRGAEE